MFDSGKKYTHKYQLFGPVGLGTTLALSWTNPFCFWDKPRLSLDLTQWKPSLSPGQTSLSLGQTGVEGWQKGVMCQFSSRVNG